MTYIYKFNINGKSYVGSTKNIRKRMLHHSCMVGNENNKYYNLKLYKFIRENGGWDNVDICILQECNEDVRYIVEDFYIKHYKCELNMVDALRDKQKYKEYVDNWYQDNKDRLKKVRHEWYVKNKEKLRESRKKYREENRERQKKWYEENREKQKKYREENRDKIAERSKKYREENKEKLRECRKKYRQVNNCDCGGTYLSNKSSKTRHEKTKKHQTYLASLSSSSSSSSFQSSGIKNSVL